MFYSLEVQCSQLTRHVKLLHHREFMVSSIAGAERRLTSYQAPHPRTSFLLRIGWSVPNHIALTGWKGGCRIYSSCLPRKINEIEFGEQIGLSPLHRYK